MANPENVKKIIEKIDELPTLPTVINKLMELLENPKSTANDINKVIKQDQSLTAKTLKLVNSAYYGFPRRISTVTEAVVLLGFKSVRNLALSATVCKLFQGGNETFSRERLWEHSVAVAFASRIVAKKVKYPDEEEAFVGGLLHDIAKIVEDQHLHDDFIECVKKSMEEKKELTEIETEIIGLDHSLIGRRISDRWNLPSKITKVIRYHHQPEFSGEGDEKTLAYIVHVADVLVRIRKLGDSGNHGPYVLSKTAAPTLKINKQDLEEIVKKLMVEMKNASDFLKIIKEE